MVNVSLAAVQEIERLKSNRQISDSPLRLAVKSGGCFGLYYNLEFDSTILANDNSPRKDRLVEISGVELIVDAQSWEYVKHLQLDYSEDLMGGGFRFHNPQNRKTCGCGISFTEPAKT